MQYFSTELWTVIIAGASLFVLFQIWQAYSVATRGQSFGKRLLGIKIVDSEGFVPGLARGVLIRRFPVFVVGSLAYFALGGFAAAGLKVLLWSNLAVILLSPPRCGHDLIAGTFVVTATA